MSRSIRNYGACSDRFDRAAQRALDEKKARDVRTSTRAQVKADVNRLLDGRTPAEARQYLVAMRAVVNEEIEPITAPSPRAVARERAEALFKGKGE